MIAVLAKPLVGISCCVKDFIHTPNHAVSETYVDWVAHGTGCTPILIPALGPDLDFDGLLSHLDGVVLTGSRSNVEPHHYDGATNEPDPYRDPSRDATTLPLILEVLERGIPLLAICRGFQELNVALGGTLHQKIQLLPGKLDHTSPSEQPTLVRFSLAHHVDLVPGGYLARLLGTTRLMVNSLHHQGIDRLADGLTVEAVAPDGIIEGVQVEEARAYVVGVQWHPERRPMGDAHAGPIFADFGTAVMRHAGERHAAHRE
ncbi:MAG: gamma-glutamyl-gamma-aminobutyrate hydrolase family protein, partial [Vicinamibacterales bacterium]|nr:gamma-glutamyl-gamma-aminobutyrate hydrolase family protein [Vicinamibacterales bacterium]